MEETTLNPLNPKEAAIIKKKAELEAMRIRLKEAQEHRESAQRQAAELRLQVEQIKRQIQETRNAGS
ncbi:unnamed protein product [Bursaphelenchus xylophilus]|uniref:(pine wood nematode) hypothetical protein n=1 Tax=Bursaphelenchus xylophilus TaxID=6326 RepID=A0A1I7S8X0_BURXY|nr:unnamed protein product [Bursaphelenchus xylophilus]CAG9085967.1 unnamed protein product [Bursaphelenchus xylophilus]